MCSGKNVRLTPMKKSQNCHLPEPLAQHSPGDLREPVVDGREQREHRAADQHVVQVRDDEIGVMDLEVERHRAEHDAGQPADQQDEEEAEHEEQRRPHDQPAGPRSSRSSRRSAAPSESRS